MLDIIDPMNVGKTFVERNERRKFQRFFITSYFLNTQTTVARGRHVVDQTRSGVC